MESGFRGDEADRSLSKPEPHEVSGAESAKGVLSGCVVVNIAKRRRDILQKSLQKEYKSPS